jgi:uncharacterized membrane protein HdeD (DUF308 family)
MVNEVAAVAKNWWLFVLLGAISVVVGVLAIAWPDITLLTLGIFFGIYLMVAAILEIIDAIFGEPGGRALSAILGVITLIAGVICFRRPGESLLAIVIVVGVYLIAEGVFRIVRALGSEGRRWWGVAIGALDAIVGIVIISWPGIGLVTLAVFFAVSMLVRGIFSIVIGLKLRSLPKEEPGSVEQSATFA